MDEGGWATGVKRCALRTGGLGGGGGVSEDTVWSQSGGGERGGV